MTRRVDGLRVVGMTTHRTMLTWAAAHTTNALHAAIERLQWRAQRVGLSAYEADDLHYLTQERGNRAADARKAA